MRALELLFGVMLVVTAVIFTRRWMMAEADEKRLGWIVIGAVNAAMAAYFWLARPL